MISPVERLKNFQEENNVSGKGALSFVIQFTRMISDHDFPLNEEAFKTKKGGQIAGLSGKNLRKILTEYDINMTLSSEGGRTSRGNMDLMVKYIAFLNAWNKEEKIDFKIIEEFWIERVKEYFQNELNYIAGKGGDGKVSR
ncbi:MAG: DUF4928 family protein [Clostridiales bacterium]|nr:DUF4928 family protein [Clostridiales bacterium]